MLCLAWHWTGGSGVSAGWLGASVLLSVCLVPSSHGARGAAQSCTHRSAGCLLLSLSTTTGWCQLHRRQVVKYPSSFPSEMQALQKQWSEPPRCLTTLALGLLRAGGKLFLCDSCGVPWITPPCPPAALPCEWF